MTRKDYKLIARVLSDYIKNPRLSYLIERFCEELKRDNPRFKLERFIKAVKG